MTAVRVIADHVSTSEATLIAAHATGASFALLLGPVNLLRRAKGDTAHRRIGRVWVVLMYWTVLSSFAIKRLRPGHFSWIHLLSIFTFCTLTIGLWAALTGRIDAQRGYMRGSYFGLLGAFAGAVAVPVRAIPQFAAQHPLAFAAAVAAVGTAAAMIVRMAVGRSQRRERPTGTPVKSGPTTVS